MSIYLAASAIGRLNNYFPQNWIVLNSMFNVIKVLNRITK